MNRLVFVISVCLFFIKGVEHISESIIIANGVSMCFDMTIPAGYTMTRVESGTDVDNYLIFSYPDGSYIYISNKWSPNTTNIVSKYHIPETSIPLTNNDSGYYCIDDESNGVILDRIMGNPLPDSLVFKGYSLKVRSWGEIEYPDYCIGYQKAAIWNTNKFEESIRSFQKKRLTVEE